tara:strand:+ start:486 stop:692 length:207 start_codon:yes stop_codon:yes gene_type:complete
MDIEFTTDIGINKVDDNNTKKLIITEWQWQLLSQLFSFQHTLKENTNNEWMVDELLEFIDQAEEKWGE